ncbi:MAG: mandelate racemase/muconate lactonizing enzyme family protein [Alphaproteobacteria bacterium]|nr:mandelate racemase/muconate lactonizing enzyme family protein [Alphaproteobacteria bacterium]
MKVTAIETIRLEEFPNLLWVELHTDQGISGLGETFYGVDSAEAHIHGLAAAYLLGKNPLEIDKHSKGLVGYLGFASSSAEMRGNSAIDIALWDLFGQATGLPIYQLLGGAARERMRVYNTCAGYRYVRARPVQSTANFGLPQGKAEGPYEDLDGFLNRADELAESLLEMGITGMKIWPFDYAAEASGGLYISGPDLAKAMEPFAKIRKAVGNRMDIHVELHSMWNLTAAKTIARALEPFEPFWYEDPIKMDSLGSLAEYARSTRIPVTASETLGGRGPFRQLLELNAVGYVMLDLSWVGGLSEARKIAAMAEAWHLPVAPHDCTGPVVLTASVHLSQNATNGVIQEVVRAFYYGWYRELVTGLPPLENGYIRAPDGPGLGIKLLPDLKQRKDARVRISKL